MRVSSKSVTCEPENTNDRTQTKTTSFGPGNTHPGATYVDVVGLGVVHAHRHGGFVQAVRHAAAEMMHERVMVSRGGQGEVLLMLHRELLLLLLLLLLLDVMWKRRRGQMARQLGLGRQRQVVVRVTVQKARLQLPASVAAFTHRPQRKD